MGKIKVLLLAANPVGTTQLKLDEEVRAITKKIASSDRRDSLELVIGLAARADDFLQLLNLHKPHIVHFSGHGSPSGELLVVDSNGHVKPISRTAIKALFTTLKDNVQIVVLNACYSQIQAQAIAEVIDYTIGMNSSIGDQAAIVFASSFYRAIGFGRSVKEAFEQGKTALLLEGIPEDNTPELLVKKGADPAYKFFEVVLSDSPQTFLKALGNEITFNLDKLDEFARAKYRVASGKIFSGDKEDASFNYFTCMTSIFESVELQKVLSLADKDMRDSLSHVYRGFREINDNADALMHVFRPWRASQYIDAIAHFENNLRLVAERLVRDIQK